MAGITKHWAYWLIVIGLGMDVLDTLTTPAGATAGILFGPTGPLAGVNNAIPGTTNLGEAIAVVGAIGLVLHKGE